MSSEAEVLRNRKINFKLLKNVDDNTENKDEKKAKEELNKIISFRSVDASSYHLTRIILIRFIGFIYAVAFLIALNQNVFLFGKNGLKPVNKYLKQLQMKMAPNSDKDSFNDYSLASKLFLKVPTLFWFINWSDGSIDTWLDIVATLGLLLSATIMITGCANSILMFTLWILYHSIVNVGQTWYSFGMQKLILYFK